MTDRERIEELQEEVRQLRALLDERLSHQWPEEWRLTQAQSRFLSAVVSAPGGFAGKEYVYGSLYNDTNEPRVGQILNVLAHNVRKKLPPERAARLITVWGRGWRWERAVKASAEAAS